MYILTAEINEYRQEGLYFVAAWEKKPTLKELQRVLPKRSKEYIQKQILEGRGRRGDEYEWFRLIEYANGRVYYEAD